MVKNLRGMQYGGTFPKYFGWVDTLANLTIITDVQPRYLAGVPVTTSGSARSGSSNFVVPDRASPLGPALSTSVGLK